MSKKIILGAILTGCAVTASADVLINTPEEIVVLSINDQEMKKSIFGGTKNTYRLEAGTHQIAVKYQQIFEDNYVSHDIVRSGIVTLNTGNLIDQQTYHLALVNPPSSHDEAKKFAEQPVIALKDASGQIVAQHTGSNTASQPLLSSLLGKNNEIDVRGTKQVASQTAIVKAPESAPTVVQGSVPVSVPTQVVKSEVVAAIKTSKDQQLIDLWKSASAQERQKFMTWLAEQASK